MKNIIIKIIICILIINTSISAETCNNTNNEQCSNFNIDNSIVKIHVTGYEHDWTHPWRQPEIISATGSGCIIENNLILTNAHVATNTLFIQVNKAGDPNKYIAKVVAILHEADLALLSVEDEVFFANTHPIEIGKMPKRGDKITVRGFPMGGNELSITEGIISRIENRIYTHGQANLLAIQIDAAINSGNSGGPAIKDNKIVGIAFQGIDKSISEGLDYIIPVTIIEHFLNSYKNKSNTEFPSLLISIQSLENPSLRKSLDIPEEMSGVLVTKIFPNSPLKGVIQKQDVITAIDNVDIANDGTISFDENTRVTASTLITDHFIGDPINIKIIRKGKVISNTTILNKKLFSEKLVPHQEYDTTPTYYIFAGLVFQKLNADFIFDINSAEQELINLFQKYQKGTTTSDLHQLAVLSSILTDDINKGYEKLKLNIVKEVNGKHIGSMQELVSAIEENQQEYHFITLENDGIIVLDREKAEKVHPDILKSYLIESDRSDDLKNLNN